jgi:hypothetical protein
LRASATSANSNGSDAHHAVETTRSNLVQSRLGPFCGEGSRTTSTGRQLGETGGLICAGGVWWGEGPRCGMGIDIIIRDPAASAICHMVLLTQLSMGL